jgi:hypothetical protein
MTFPYLIAIDPGLHGAIAWRCDGAAPGVAKLCETPTDLLAQIRGLPNFTAGAVCFFEQVGGFVGRAQPGSRMFTFGRQVGVIEGILTVLQVEIRKISPQKWQKALSALSRPGEPKSVHKRRLRALALELYPLLRSQITVQTADALLILHAAKEILRAT